MLQGVKSKQLSKNAYYAEYQVTGKSLAEVLRRTAIISELFSKEKNMVVDHSKTKKNKHRVVITITF